MGGAMRRDFLGDHRYRSVCCLKRPRPTKSLANCLLTLLFVFVLIDRSAIAGTSVNTRDCSPVLVHFQGNFTMNCHSQIEALRTEVTGVVVEPFVADAKLNDIGRSLQHQFVKSLV